jgi:hypothetical protein
MSKSNYKKDYTKDEQELEVLVTEDVVVNTPATDPEDENWKKRYGNLRTHAQKEKEKAESELAELKAQIERSSTRNSTEIPADPEELKQWMSDYPKVVANIRALMGQELKDVKDKITATEKDTQTRNKQSRLEKAKTDLHTAHPDFYGGETPIVKSQQFWDWLNQKEEEGVPTHKQNFEKGDNARLASDSLKLFKLETEYGVAKKTKANSNDGASSIRGGNSTTPSSSSNQGHKYTESQIESMNPREYDLLEDKIEEALRNGQVLMDISG